MMIRVGPTFWGRMAFMLPLRSVSVIVTWTSSESKSSEQTRTGLHIASFTAALTSSSIAAANCSRSSWVSRAESRVFGFLGLYGIRAGGHMV